MNIVATIHAIPTISSTPNIVPRNAANIADVTGSMLAIRLAFAEPISDTPCIYRV